MQAEHRTPSPRHTGSLALRIVDRSAARARAGRGRRGGSYNPLMLRVITPEESARLDAAAADPVEVLMDRAGLAVALAAVAMGAGYGTRVAVLAGAGNNGGDGYVAARYLARRGCAVAVHALAPPRDAEGAAAAAAGAGEAGDGDAAEASSNRRASPVRREASCTPEGSTTRSEPSVTATVAFLSCSVTLAELLPEVGSIRSVEAAKRGPPALAWNDI